ncbi:hypothetical protein IQ268_22815 [Oculatella sp. LEGE 06141]|uniref:hypothetical protein n=1 Tax=Oculatella sp. LEGE 06141 TaxID=1828648 RepID=UPI00187E94B6|nr:hypothetical protein [Oculatella sp. LEGE 06141]MBE9181398.1 hypothetical protein [Oculatella sp. LEGE 06141]
MRSVRSWLSISIGLLLGLGNSAAIALPGQTTEEVAAWIQGHPTLRPASGETLLVRKSDTPARRFTFQALTTSPGRATPERTLGMIRSEQISLFDLTNGVSRNRLEETLRVIYGSEIYQDYEQAEIIYVYPANATEGTAPPINSSSTTALHGEIRQGARFAYWVETAHGREGLARVGQISVFATADVEKLEVELRGR